jgi:hypothetical protein
VLAGLLFGLLQSEPTAPSIKSGDLPWIALILAGLGLVAVLMILGVWLRYDIASMFWPAVVNALLTSFLTVYTNAAVDVPEIAAPIGLAVGIVVGTILCCLCRWTRLSDCIGVRHV